MNERILGRAERVELPEFDLKDLPAKIDTGAYSSSLDCERVELVKNGQTEELEFVLLHPNRPGYTGQALRAGHFERTEVTNANGVSDRFVIYTDIVINGESIKSRFTLTDRSKLRYPVLIGRKFIREAKYLVDVSKGQGLPQDEEDRDL